jgi:hypothetical protein
VVVAAPATRDDTGHEFCFALICFLVGGPYNLGHDLVVGREVTDRVRARRVAGELERLAAAPAEIYLAAIATPAGLGHPLRSPETLEEWRFVPDPC